MPAGVPVPVTVMRPVDIPNAAPLVRLADAWSRVPSLAWHATTRYKLLFSLTKCPRQQGLSGRSVGVTRFHTLLTESTHEARCPLRTALPAGAASDALFPRLQRLFRRGRAGDRTDSEPAGRASTRRPSFDRADLPARGGPPRTSDCPGVTGKKAALSIPTAPQLVHR
jgi:hypothetical protein